MGLLRRAHPCNLLSKGLTAICVSGWWEKCPSWGRCWSEIGFQKCAFSGLLQETDLAYNRVCVSEHILNTDNFYHSKAFGYNLTFCFSFSWRRPFLKPTSDLISEICKKAVAYWQKVLQCHLIRLILFLRNKKISIGALLPCFGTAERGGGYAALLAAKFLSFNSGDCAVLKNSGKKTVRLCGEKDSLRIESSASLLSYLSLFIS